MIGLYTITVSYKRYEGEIDMDFHRDPRLEAEIYGRLQSKYLQPRPEGPHLSELIGCLTRSYYDRTEPLPPSPEEMLYFAIGFALEEVLLRDKESGAVAMQELDGVYMTPDYIDLRGVGVDLKSTRMRPKGDDGVPSMGWPKGWIRQFQAYTKLLSQGKPSGVYETDGGSSIRYYNFSVAIMYLIKPDLVCGTFAFTDEELQRNWAWVQQRRERYEQAFKTLTIPIPFTFAEEWQCRNCRYSLRCQSQGTSSTSAGAGGTT